MRLRGRRKWCRGNGGGEGKMVVCVGSRLATTFPLQNDGLPIDAELTRVIVPDEADGRAGLDAMQRCRNSPL